MLIGSWHCVKDRSMSKTDIISSRCLLFIGMALHKIHSLKLLVVLVVVLNIIHYLCNWLLGLHKIRTIHSFKHF